MDAANIALQSHVDVKQRSDLFLRAATRLQNPYHYLMIITIMITRRFPVGCKTTISTLTEVLFFALLHLPWHGCFCCVYVLSAMWTIPGRPLLRGRTCVIDFHPIHRSLKWTEQSSHTIRLELSDRCLTYVGLWPTDFFHIFFPTFSRHLEFGWFDHALLQVEDLSRPGATTSLCRSRPTAWRTSGGIAAQWTAGAWTWEGGTQFSDSNWFKCLVPDFWLVLKSQPLQ